MKQFKVVFKYKETGYTTEKEIPGSDIDDARRWAEGVAAETHTVESITPAIEQQRDNRPSCHYCGQPANGRGFFDEPACKECGG